jgi:hypothetical protein
MISIRKPEEQYDAEESCCIQLTMTVIWEVADIIPGNSQL